MNRQKKRKPYEKPKIVFEKELEVQAAVCDSAWIPGGLQCQIEGDGECLRARF
jgi:hypothetical protein